MRKSRVLLLVAILLGITAGYSSGSYCVCKDGVAENLLQTNIDYACGDGKANCRAINTGGSCYQPDTVKAHCDYAVNYYYQLQKEVNGSCDFSGTAMVTDTIPPANVASPGCSYPASPSQVNAAAAAAPASTPSITSATGSPSSSTTYGVPIAPTAFDNNFNTNAAGQQQAFSLLVILLMFLSSFLCLRG